MVRDDDSVDPTLARLTGVIRVEDPLENDREGGRAAQPLESLPGEARVREDPEEVPDRRADVLLGRLLQSGLEDRIREVLGDPDALQEREVGLLEIAGLPAGQVVVDGEDDGRVAGGLGSPDQARCELVVVGPVELVPARPVAVRHRHLLQGRRRGRARDQRQADGRCGPGRGELALVMEKGLHADRCEQDRRRHRSAEQLDGEIPHGEVLAQDPRNDPPASKGLEVRPHRVLGPRPAEDVGDGAVVEGLAGALLELAPGDRQRRALAGEHPLGVDLAVVVAEGGRGRLRGRHGPGIYGAGGGAGFLPERFFFLASGFGGFLMSRLQSAPWQSTSPFSFFSRNLRTGK